MVRHLETKTGFSSQQVYTSDIPLLKQFFNQLKDTGKEDTDTEAFGIPFMMARQGEELVAFASFTEEGGVANLSFYHHATVDISKLASWKSHVLKEAAFHPYASLKDKTQLKNSIRQLTGWLNNVN